MGCSRRRSFYLYDIYLCRGQAGEFFLKHSSSLIDFAEGDYVFRTRLQMFVRDLRQSVVADRPV